MRFLRRPSPQELQPLLEGGPLSELHPRLLLEISVGTVTRVKQCRRELCCIEKYVRDQPNCFWQSRPGLPHLVRCRQFTLHRDHPLVHPDLGFLPEGYLRARGLQEGGDVGPLAPDHQPASREWNAHALREGERRDRNKNPFSSSRGMVEKIGQSVTYMPDKNR